MQFIVSYKWPLILLLAGFAIRTAGALFLIMHWPGSMELTFGGIIFMITAIVWMIVKLIPIKK